MSQVSAGEGKALSVVQHDISTHHVTDVYNDHLCRGNCVLVACFFRAIPR